MAEAQDIKNIDTSVLDTIANQKGANLWQQAQEQYPYLANKDVAYLYTPSKEQRYLEFYSPEETGSPEEPRPAQLPIGKVGIQVFNPQTRPIDILGDYVSHYGVQQDPKLQQYYQQFAQQLDPAVMQERYQWHQQNAGEQRPYQQWYESSGLPEVFRGYTFDQWGPEGKNFYTPEQLQILNQVRNYLGVK